jgi:hypothetical protein
MIDDRPYAIGDWVRIAGSPSIYKVMGYSKDGSVSLYGGDPDPNGRRGSRAIMPDRLKSAKPPAHLDDNVPSPILKRRAKRTRR